jgi:hypothetical protein
VTLSGKTWREILVRAESHPTLRLFPLEWRPQWQATDGAGDIPIG